MQALKEIQREALDRTTPVQDEESVPIEEAEGRILASSIMLPDELAPHDQASIEGYAIAYANLSPNRLSTFRVVADLPVGKIPDFSVGLFEAVGVRCGSQLPEGCDCVVGFDVVKHEKDRIIIPPGQKRGQNILRAGKKITQCREAITAGKRLTSPDLVTLLTQQMKEITVVRRVKVAVLSSGRQALMIQSALKRIGMETLHFQMAQEGDLESSEEILLQAAGSTDAILSMGRLSDEQNLRLLKTVSSIGEIKRFDAAIEPAIHHAFGRIRGVPFISLQGAPMAAWVHFLLVARPALFHLMGSMLPDLPRFECAFRGRFQKKNTRLSFITGRIHYGKDGNWVEAINSPGDDARTLSALSGANALIMLPEGNINLVSGDRVTVQLINCE